LTSPRGIAVGRGVELAREAGVDSQEEETEGMRKEVCFGPEAISQDVACGYMGA
jgi:hypothetical protein